MNLASQFEDPIRFIRFDMIHYRKFHHYLAGFKLSQLTNLKPVLFFLYCRQNTAYLDSLGKTIKAFTRMIPEGLLVFFPSYPVLNTCADRWQENGIWSAICEVKVTLIL